MRVWSVYMYISLVRLCCVIRKSCASISVEAETFESELTFRIEFLLIFRGWGRGRGEGRAMGTAFMQSLDFDCHERLLRPLVRSTCVFDDTA